MAPSIVVLLNTPLILLPMRLIPKVSPRFDVFLQAKKQVVIRRCSTKELCTALVKKKKNVQVDRCSKEEILWNLCPPVVEQVKGDGQQTASKWLGWFHRQIKLTWQKQQPTCQLTAICFSRWSKSNDVTTGCWVRTRNAPILMGHCPRW